MEKTVLTIAPCKNRQTPFPLPETQYEEAAIMQTRNGAGPRLPPFCDYILAGLSRKGILKAALEHRLLWNILKNLTGH